MVESPPLDGAERSPAPSSVQLEGAFLVVVQCSLKPGLLQPNSKGVTMNVKITVVVPGAKDIDSALSDIRNGCKTANVQGCLFTAEEFTGPLPSAPVAPAPAPAGFPAFASVAELVAAVKTAIENP